MVESENEEGLGICMVTVVDTVQLSIICVFRIQIVKSSDYKKERRQNILLLHQRKHKIFRQNGAECVLHAINVTTTQLNLGK